MKDSKLVTAEKRVANSSAFDKNKKKPRDAHDGAELPFGIFSRKMSTADENY